MNSDDFKLLMEAVSDTVADIVGPLKSEVKALTDLLDDVVTSDQLRAVTDSVGAVLATTESLTAGLTTVGDTMDTHIKQTDALETRVSGLGTDVKSRITGLDKAVSLVEERFGQDQSRLTTLEQVDLDKAISKWRDENDADMLRQVSALWDESWQHKIAAMIPDWTEESGHLEKRLTDLTELTDKQDKSHASGIIALSKRIGNIELTPGPDGKDGKDGIAPTAFDMVEELRRTVDFSDGMEAMIRNAIPEPVPGPAGERGADATVDPDELLTMVEGAVQRGMPEPVPGPAGKDGQDGIAGKGVDHDLILDQIAERLPHLIRNAMPDVPTALAPTDLQVIEAVKAVYPSIRQDLVKRLPAMLHRGPWNPDTQYDVGDEVVKAGSTYRLMEPSTDQPPNEAWQLTSQGRKGSQGKPGPDGTKGDTGAPGKDGISVTDMIMEGTMLVQTLSNGDVLTFDMSEFIETVIKAIGE